MMLEDDIAEETEWWKNTAFVAETTGSLGLVRR